MLFRRPSATKLSLIRSLVFATPFYLWLAVFSVQPHKEERFMYPAYPFLCLNAALTLHNILHYVGRLRSTSIVGRTPGTAKAIAAAGGISLVVALGVLRTLGTVTAYRAPLQIYAPLWTAEYEHAEGSVCLGKEWYRFPSSFFLPDKVRARFVKSDFDGLLPGQFSEERGHLGLPSAWVTPSGMNDQNIGDPGKHVRLIRPLHHHTLLTNFRLTLVHVLFWSTHIFLERMNQRWSHRMYWTLKLGICSLVLIFLVHRVHILWLESPGSLTGN